jgi:hypothetical protein
MRSTILFLDTNILLDLPRPEDYRLRNRAAMLVVVPEVMRELRGLSLSGRGQPGAALEARSRMETLVRRRGSVAGIPVGRTSTTFRILPGEPDSTVSTDRQLVLRARAEQSRHPEAMVAVVTRDWGVAELARAERVRSILLHGTATAADLERGIAEHDTALDLNL